MLCIKYLFRCESALLYEKFPWDRVSCVLIFLLLGRWIHHSFSLYFNLALCRCYAGSFGHQKQKSPVSDAQELNLDSGWCSSIQIECALAIRSIESKSGPGIRVVSCKRQHLDLIIEELDLIRGIWDEKDIEADQRNCPNIEGENIVRKM